MTHAFGCSVTDGDTQTLCQLLAFSMVWPLATKSSPSVEAQHRRGMWWFSRLFRAAAQSDARRRLSCM